MHLPPLTHTFLHLYSLSFICTHFPSFLLISLHLYSLIFTLVPYMWASMMFLPKGGRSCTGGGGEGTGSGITKVAGSGRKREKLCNILLHYAIFVNRKIQRGGSQKIQGGNWDIKGTGSGRFKPPCPPSPHLVILPSGFLLLRGPRCNVKSFLRFPCAKI